MKKLIIYTLLTIQLFAQSTATPHEPFIYSSLGDKIYNNVQSIEKLKSRLEYELDKDKITKYIKDIEETKIIGLKIHKNSVLLDKTTYLEKLRELSIINDYYVNKITDNLISSINSKDNILFLKSVNSGLLNIEKNKKAIIKYYYENNESIDSVGILKNIIDKHNKKPIFKGLTNAQLEKIEIDRIRKKDQAKQKAIEKALEEETIRKKIEIRKAQKEALGI